MKRTADTYELSPIDGICQVCEVIKEFRSNGLTYEIGDTVAVVYCKLSRTVYVCLLNEITDVTDNYGCVYGLESIIKYCDTSVELQQIETFSQFNEYFKPIQDLTESIQQYDAYMKDIYAEKCAAIENEDSKRSWLSKMVDYTSDIILLVGAITICITGILLWINSIKLAIIFGAITPLMISLMIVHAYDSTRYNKIYNKYDGPIVLPYSKWKNTNFTTE
jgi:hypothetical protein